jgi:lysyl-tRNA synthetase class 2
VQKTTDSSDWRPTAALITLHRRAQILAGIREYFAAAEVLEVETPQLMRTASPDPALQSFSVRSLAPGETSLSGFLQTSPEFAMKRLLAAGSGDIYQLCHAFRVEHPGRHHLAEFTLLEWYRIGFDHHRLMDEVESLVGAILPAAKFVRRSYAEVFREGLQLDPHCANTADLAAAATAAGIELGAASDDRSILLDALFGALFLRDCPRSQALFVYDFPVEQAAYARIERGPPSVAQRFELLIGGIEIANGYFEVTEYGEQVQRHEIENRRREALGLPVIAVDQQFLSALRAGLPMCSGVALGIDRLVLLATDLDGVGQCVAFDPFGGISADV